MFEVTYRVTLEYYAKKTGESLVLREVDLCRRAYLAAKPAIGEMVSVPFFDKVAPTPFVVANLWHHTHVEPRDALSFKPLYLGQVYLTVAGCANKFCREISSYLDDADWHDNSDTIIARTVALGWTVEQSKP